MQALMTLVKFQEAASKLYRIFSDKAFNKKQYWMSLSIEKNLSVRWIRAQYIKPTSGLSGLSEGRLDITLLENSLNFILTQVAAWEKKELSFAQALMISAKIESVLLENKFFQAHGSDSYDLKYFLNALARAYLDHYKRIKDTLEREH
tara:strand:- start:1754 stop:2197 length:444 start_codon:yes stop_codon:yes gene_type:complete